uniref:Uncharacterized protein n=1 Tax=Rhizophagus irregularis (strain DAOM 181602 / DAOM 197198 / MUCL 43194) TaxID=747089 RepID=U9UIV6_RHIID
MRVLVLPAKISSPVSYVPIGDTRPIEQHNDYQRHYNKILRTNSTITIRFSTEYLLVCSYCLNQDTPVNEYLLHAGIFCPQYGTVIIRHITDGTDVPEYLHYSLQDLVKSYNVMYSAGLVRSGYLSEDKIRKLHELTGVVGAENQKKHDVLHSLTLLFTSVIDLQRTCKDVLEGTDRSKGLVQILNSLVQKNAERASLL